MPQPSRRWAPAGTVDAMPEASTVRDELTCRLRRFVRPRVATPEDAEDVIQDAYLRVLRYSAGRRVQDRERLLFSVAKNLAVDNRRREQARQRTLVNRELLDCSASEWPAAEHVADLWQRLSQLETAISLLPPRCRQVFLMHRLEGMSYGQIARACAISPSAVEKHIARASGMIDSTLNGGRKSS
jgi:RNA polymerase sigma factor (sigma-70 family)